MAPAIETLREEHRNIRRLLDALEHQIEIVASATSPDYDLLSGIADYFCDYPDRCHHPKEDLVMERLRARHPQDAASLGDLAREHLDNRARASRFRENIQALHRDAIMPRDTFVRSARSFIDAERLHMRMEEERFFPLAERKLTSEDWQIIDARLTNERDPLFGFGIEDSISELRERLLAWERDFKPG